MKMTQNAIAGRIEGMLADGGERSIAFAASGKRPDHYAQEIIKLLKQLTPSEYEELLDRLTDINAHRCVGDLVSLVPPGEKSRYR